MAYHAESLTSQRAKNSVSAPNAMRDLLMDAWQDLFNTEKPVINLGVAQNDLMKEELSEKINASLAFQPQDLNYGEAHGSRKLRGIMASLINRHFKTQKPLEYDDILTTTGAGAAIYYLVLGVTDPGDSVMILTPYYGNFEADVVVGTEVDIVAVNPADDIQDLSIDTERLETALAQATERGKKIKALIVTNPHNPLGRCYEERDLRALLRFASKHNIHVISDEVYGLSTISHLAPGNEGQDDPFVSVLALSNLEQEINPKLVHVVYSLSKDFGLNGFRVGFIIEPFDKALRDFLKLSMTFSYISAVNDRLLCNMLSDEQWVDNFVTTNRLRIADAYQIAASILNKHKIPFIPSQCGHFMLIDLRDILRSCNGRDPTIEDEKKIWRTLLDKGVYMAPGHVFRTAEAGYFRLTYTVAKEQIEKGLDTLADIL